MMQSADCILVWEVMSPLRLTTLIQVGCEIWSGDVFVQNSDSADLYEMNFS